MGFVVHCYRLVRRWLVPETHIVSWFIARYLPSVVAPGFLVDIGAGTAPYAPVFARVVPQGLYRAVDLIRDDRTDVVADAHRLPFAPDRVSLFALFHTLMHLNDPRRVLAELHAALAPSGLVLVTYTFMATQVRSRDLWRWSRSGMEVELQRAGFTVIAHHQHGGALYLLTAILADLPGRLLIRHKRGWRSGRSAVDAALLLAAFMLSLPFHVLGFAALVLDRALPQSPLYVGATVLARKVADGH
jgi:SAM-dependent methyltransferase